MSRRAIAGVTTLLAAFLCAVGAPPARAHDQPYSYIDIRLRPDAMEGTITAHVVDLAHEIGFAPADSLLRPATAARLEPALRAMLERRMDLVADGARIQPLWSTKVPSTESHRLAFHWQARWRR